ncbi:hypothetical protein [Streptomyces sp. LaPpAH-108]|uniref:hypothetical protein n=1 Tax=Streptomyces sp. LaPpAH-108 TaxID=1155714 RepID=UPI0003A8D500|nr:hypothetical protein [Streptomyces sp. LaPpAH-108]
MGMTDSGDEAAHGVDCRALRSADPGRVVHEDDVQIVVVPHARDAAAVHERTNTRK